MTRSRFNLASEGLNWGENVIYFLFRRKLSKARRHVRAIQGDTRALPSARV